MGIEFVTKDEKVEKEDCTIQFRFVNGVYVLVEEDETNPKRKYLKRK